MVTCSIGFQYGTLFVDAVDVSGKRYYPTELRISSAALDVAIAYPQIFYASGSPDGEQCWFVLVVSLLPL